MVTLRVILYGSLSRSCCGRLTLDLDCRESERTGEPTVVDLLACAYGLVMHALPFKAIFNLRGPWGRGGEVIEKNGETDINNHEALLDQIRTDLSNL